MTHYERAAKYVNKKLGVKFRTSHIESLEKQFEQVAEEERLKTLSEIVAPWPLLIDQISKEAK